MIAFREIICFKKNIILLSSILIGLLPFGAFAHKVNVFADLDSGVINISCYYSTGEVVRNGKITIFDLKNAATVYRGTTDEAGILSLKVPETIIKDNSDIKIVLDAGMGHRAEWAIPFEEIVDSQKNVGSNTALCLDLRRKANEPPKKKLVHTFESFFPKILLGLIVIFLVFGIVYFLTKKKKGNVS